MAYCAYCLKSSVLTREHVIPRWYIKTSGKIETFNMRAPIAQTTGDIIVKDVCAQCNNTYLGALDGYAKKLYDAYFKEPVYSEETIEFEYDKTRLFRWLLKISYNSARANNADVEILSLFTNQIIGAEPPTDHTRIFLNLVVPTKIDKVPKPAIRQDINHYEIEEPSWFRVTQLRMSFDPSILVVQRQILINSFVFTVFAVSTKLSLPSKQLEQVSQEFLQLFPDAKELNHTGKVALKAGNYHAIQSIAPLFSQYPNRFQDADDTIVRKLHGGETGLILVEIPLELIQNQDVETIESILADMVSTIESAIAYKQKVSIFVVGFDNDSRELWQIPEVREYLCLLLTACPFIMFLLCPEGRFLKVFFEAWIYEEKPDQTSQSQKISSFLDLTFDGLNKTMHRLGLSIELNKEISEDAFRTLH